MIILVFIISCVMGYNSHAGPRRSSYDPSDPRSTQTCCPLRSPVSFIFKFNTHLDLIDVISVLV